MWWFQDAAENRLREVETAIAEHRYIHINKNVKLNLKKLYDWYMVLPEVKALSSFTTLRGRLLNVLRILGNGVIIDQLSIEMVNDYRDSRGKEPSARRIDEFVTTATINKEISSLKTMLNRALIYKKIESNPIAKCPMLKEDNVRERVLTDEEFERLLEVAPAYLRPVVITAFYEPMRRNEIIKLQWSEVDLKTEPGFIRLAAKRTKGKKTGRAIPLHPRVKQMLSSLPSRFKQGRVFLKDEKPFDDFKRSFATAKKDAEIKDFVFHDFRHCAVTNLRKAGNDYSTIMKATGHKTMSMFFRYNLVDEEDVAKMRWKGQQRDKPSEIKSKLIAAGLDPEEVKMALNQKPCNTKTDAV
jgi:integrase